MSIVSVNAKAALDTVGATPHDVVIASIYMVNLTPEKLEEVMPLFLATFDGTQPCITLSLEILARSSAHVLGQKIPIGKRMDEQVLFDLTNVSYLFQKAGLPLHLASGR